MDPVHYPHNEQDFTFTEGMSLMVLAVDKQSGGWCRDAYGVSWQPVTGS